MGNELQIAIATLIEPYVQNLDRILEIASAVEELSAIYPAADRAEIASSLQKYAIGRGVTVLLNSAGRPTSIAA
jgi:hypothetical protein